MQFLKYKRRMITAEVPPHTHTHGCTQPPPVRRKVEARLWNVAAPPSVFLLLEAALPCSICTQGLSHPLVSADNPALCFMLFQEALPSVPQLRIARMDRGGGEKKASSLQAGLKACRTGAGPQAVGLTLDVDTKGICLCWHNCKARLTVYCLISWLILEYM